MASAATTQEPQATAENGLDTDAPVCYLDLPQMAKDFGLTDKQKHTVLGILSNHMFLKHDKSGVCKVGGILRPYPLLPKTEETLKEAQRIFRKYKEI